MQVWGIYIKPRLLYFVILLNSIIHDLINRPRDSGNWRNRFANVYFVLISVIFVISRGGDVRQVMIHAQKAGYINGEYAFISVHLFGNDWHSGDDSWYQVRH